MKTVWCFETYRCVIATPRDDYYGTFATLLLHAAVIKDNVYTSQASKQSLKYSAANPRSSAKLAEYIRNLISPIQTFSL